MGGALRRPDLHEPQGPRPLRPAAAREPARGLLADRLGHLARRHPRRRRARRRRRGGRRLAAGRPAVGVDDDPADRGPHRDRGRGPPPPARRARPDGHAHRGRRRHRAPDRPAPRRAARARPAPDRLHRRAARAARGARRHRVPGPRHDRRRRGDRAPSRRPSAHRRVRGGSPAAADGGGAQVPPDGPAGLDRAAPVRGRQPPGRRRAHRRHPAAQLAPGRPPQLAVLAQVRARPADRRAAAHPAGAGDGRRSRSRSGSRRPARSSTASRA